METSILQVKNLNKSFANHKILSNINLNISKGDIYGLVGVNGVGKTTLIKMILDLLKADDGEITINGNSSLNYLAREKLAYLPEKFHPSPFLIGKEFLNLSSAQFNQKYDHRKAKEIAEKLDLDLKALNTKISKYSKGMGQKLGLISVFLSNSEFLILDEPMSGLDPHVRIRLKDILKQYAKSENTIFFSSHILSDIDEICNKIAVIHEGKIIFDGRPEDFKKKFDAKTLERAFLKAIGK